jgi:hypothetical protein
MSYLRWLSLMFLSFALASSLSACSEGKCDECPAEGCPSFVGDYVGVQGASMETCGDWYLIQGESFTEIVEGGQSGNSLEIVLRDNRGLWELLTGEICASSDTEPPRSYPFNVYGDTTDPNDGSGVRYTLSGILIEGSADGPARMSANLSLVLYGMELNGEACTLSGYYEATRVEY